MHQTVKRYNIKVCVNTIVGYMESTILYCLIGRQKLMKYDNVYALNCILKVVISWLSGWIGIHSITLHNRFIDGNEIKFDQHLEMNSYCFRVSFSRHILQIHKFQIHSTITYIISYDSRIANNLTIHTKILFIVTYLQLLSR